MYKSVFCMENGIDSINFTYTGSHKRFWMYYRLWLHMAKCIFNCEFQCTLWCVIRLYTAYSKTAYLPTKLKSVYAFGLFVYPSEHILVSNWICAICMHAL